MRNRWTRSTYRKRGKIKKISPRGAGPRDETLFFILSLTSYPPLPSRCLSLSLSLTLALSLFDRAAPPPSSPEEQPHHSLFFTNAPCCQPDWPLRAGFANKFHLSASRPIHVEF